MQFLSVNGDRIVNEMGEEVRLRGVCLSGYVHLENYLHGFPGVECSWRAALNKVLGTGKADFFWERWMDAYFTEADAAYISSMGANVIRLAMNYRQFESDDRPFDYLEAGFQRVDRLLDWCEKHGLYVILDLHAAQGWQNTDWHSDNSHRHTFLWHDRLYQDRFVALWQAFAGRYRSRAVIAGYDLMNEPVSNAPFGRFNNTYTPNWPAFNALIQRTVNSIREIDTQHIIFIEGDLYGTRFNGLDAPFAGNLAYSSHHYHPSTRGKTKYPDRQPNGDTWDFEFQHKLLTQHEGTLWTTRNQVPNWMGEFGAQYLNEAGSVSGQMQALDDQIEIFGELGLHWTYWNYKDIGAAGWVFIDPESPYARLVEPIQKVKRALSLDPSTSYLVDPGIVGEFMGMANHIIDRLDDASIDRTANITFMGQTTLTLYTATLYQESFARQFEGMSEKQLDDLAKSFLFENCRPAQPLMAVIEKRLKGIAK